MKQRRKAKRQKMSVLPMAMSLALGILTVLVISLLFSAVFAMVDLDDWVLNLFAFVILIAGCGVTGWFAGIAYRRSNPLVMGAVSGVVMVLLCLLGNLLFFQSGFELLSLLKYIVMIAASCVASLCMKKTVGSAGKRKPIAVRKEILP